MPQHRAWLDAGWRTSNLNLIAERITFERFAPLVPAESLIPVEVAPAMPMRHVWDDVARKLVLGMGMSWTPLGVLMTDGAGRLALPDAPSAPGIYCLRIRKEDSERRYIGEAANVARRFYNYRNPGSKQSTNIRVNAVLLEALHHGAEISASAAVDGAWLDWGSGPLKADLSSQTIRRLFENAALIEAHAADIETLNRGTGLNSHD